ncbi:MAG TPA: cation-transporting P-type ATPase [Gemmataceae bacterium]|nr:cation-transporting P-type ATPase [Gemmataceae bacterium]
MNEPSVQEPVNEHPVAQSGLTRAEAQSRLARYGNNELAEKTVNPLLKLLSSFWGQIPWTIEAGERRRLQGNNALMNRPVTPDSRDSLTPAEAQARLA